MSFVEFNHLVVGEVDADNCVVTKLLTKFQQFIWPFFDKNEWTITKSLQANLVWHKVLNFSLAVFIFWGRSILFNFLLCICWHFFFSHLMIIDPKQIPNFINGEKIEMIKMNYVSTEQRIIKVCCCNLCHYVYDERRKKTK